ncbi:hypothetical protein MWU52_00445 [Jannaschia sp. S6380]|uniref:hypothetical protein n=1 Tax=Jannaschia sp. S6380 TaxID=2926408 RepID=UPI001FF2E3AC|nr:hypothetical protein [Jannaschia sp. S6380]MCK0166010.1 hypothetical protein [Jannaschia sp. S6380]
MDFAILLPLLALITLACGIAFALWSKSRTDRSLDKHRPHTASPLARKTPDPNFQPDPDVTDPHRVMR